MTTITVWRMRHPDLADHFFGGVYVAFEGHWPDHPPPGRRSPYGELPAPEFLARGITPRIAYHLARWRLHRRARTEQRTATPALIRDTENDTPNQR